MVIRHMTGKMDYSAYDAMDALIWNIPMKLLSYKMADLSNCLFYGFIYTKWHGFACVSVTGWCYLKQWTISSDTYWHWHLHNLILLYHYYDEFI